MKKATKKRIQPIEKKGGKVIYNMYATADSDDWMNAGRLRAQAEAGDLEARQELDKMESTDMIELED